MPFHRLSTTSLPHQPSFLLKFCLVIFQSLSHVSCYSQFVWIYHNMNWFRNLIMSSNICCRLSQQPNKSWKRSISIVFGSVEREDEMTIWSWIKTRTQLTFSMWQRHYLCMQLMIDIFRSNIELISDGFEPGGTEGVRARSKHKSLTEKWKHILLIKIKWRQRQLTHIYLQCAAVLRAQTGHENTSLLVAPTTFHLGATFRDDCEMSSSTMMGVVVAECGYQLDISPQYCQHHHHDSGRLNDSNFTYSVDATDLLLLCYAGERVKKHIV